MMRPAAGGLRRLSSVGRYVTGLSNLALVARLLACGLSLTILKYVVPLPKLAAMMWAGDNGRCREPARDHRIAALAMWIGTAGRSLNRGRCLERSLLIYRMLSELNADSRLVVGVMKKDGHLIGHAWVCIGDELIGGSRASVSDFLPIIVFGAGGTALPCPDVPA